MWKLWHDRSVCHHATLTDGPHDLAAAGRLQAPSWPAASSDARSLENLKALVAGMGNSIAISNQHWTRVHRPTFRILGSESHKRLVNPEDLRASPVLLAIKKYQGS